MKTVIFSLDEETEQGINAMAQQLGVSRSEVVRAMYAQLRLEVRLEEMQALAEPLLTKSALDSEDDITAFAKD